MPIISKETWDKFTQEEKEEITNMFDNFKEYRINMSDEKQEGVCYAIKELFPEEALQPQLTYEDVARELFKEGAWQPHDYASKYQFDKNATHTYFLNCTSQKQAEKLLAINRLLNVARFLNGKDWKPDWENMTPDDKVWSLGIDENEIRAYYVQKYDGARAEIVYFRTQQLAQEAIQILGKDTVRLALDSSY